MLRKLPDLNEKVVRFIVNRNVGRRRASNLAWGYVIAVVVVGSDFLISSALTSESAALFALVYILSAIAVATFRGLGPGILAAVLSDLAIDYHYIAPVGRVLNSWEALLSLVFCLITICLILLVLGGLNFLNENIEIARREERRAQEAVLAREQILSVVAHDLRQPLSSIGMRAGFIERMLPTPAPKSVVKDIHDIRRDVGRLDRMIGDLLDISKIDTNQLSVDRKSVDLVELARQVVETFRSTYPGCNLKLTCVPHAKVCADPDRCQQVLGNLISNAIKYGTAGAEIQVAVVARDGFSEAVVTNYGPGISEDQLSKIFDRFVRTSEAKTSGVGGLGLGLFITKGLIEAQGGRIWAESTVGDKTSFHFTLATSVAGLDQKKNWQKDQPDAPAIS